MTETLLVIDVQDCFVNYPKYKPIIKGVLKQIEFAKKRNDHIVLVEFAYRLGCGTNTDANYPSIKKLIDQVKNYDKKIFIYKDAQDGGKIVSKICKERKISLRTVRVCGVYTNWCVYNTVLSLRKLHKSITIKMPRNAVCASGYANNKSAVSELKEKANIIPFGKWKI